MLEVKNDTFRLTRRQGKSDYRAIDRFFESLASNYGPRSVGVLLSGTGTDGTRGLTAIRAEGGITIAQDSSAKHDSMVRSAIDAGVVDIVSSPSKIAAELARIGRHPYGPGTAETMAERNRSDATSHQDDKSPLPSGGKIPGDESPLAADSEAPTESSAEEAGFKRILLMLRNSSGVDFSLYKSTTIRRRIARRMVLSKHLTAKEYADFLEGNDSEMEALSLDL